ncbi:fungal-specific transcription factor domain-containing protein [Exophiala viscosa]|uniref:fungal-specific transcription factor domain-containing protein n=1 Tax=Exophiala viscosa TaxID=2486360 RepID=UPI002197058D|nr:fungal-specific transcription factor domain-containing protein [Exophiala viscosa]
MPSGYWPAPILPPTPSCMSAEVYDEIRDEAGQNRGSTLPTSTPLLPQSATDWLPNLASPTCSKDNRSEAHDPEEGVLPLHQVNWEHHGPWSWASICSHPGQKWVCQKTGSGEFADIASGLVKTWSRRLKMKRFQSLKDRNPEPDSASAMAYVAAYFERSYDAVFGVVHRPTFEARLRTHLAQFALRNIVYALGCRSLGATDPSLTFLQAGKRSRAFFQNALSVLGEMILGRSGFTAVQALVLMGFYAEGLGSHAIEYPLAINAVQLALAKGLHRAPSRSWNLPEADILTRSWLWWAVYCLEKQIVQRSGRPSTIDDDNISTPIPLKAPPGSLIDVEVFTLFIRNAQIPSQIAKRIMSVKASRQSPAEAMQTYLPPLLHLGQFRGGTYHFFYPWVAVRFRSESDPAVRNQVIHSAETVAYAARQIILVLRTITTDAAIAHWLAFYFPIYAHTNLLMYILMDPSQSSATGDLALLDICAGHFGHVEHATSTEMSFHFPRDSAALCAKVVRAAMQADRDNVTVPVTPQALSALEDAEMSIGTADVGNGTDLRLFLEPHNPVSTTSVHKY